MKKTYKEILLDPSISYCTMTECQQMPKYLYKYQGFYSKEGKENIFWRQNIRGNFHLSLGNEFEDYNDCKPYMDKNKIMKMIKGLLLSGSSHIDQTIIEGAMDEVNEVLTPEYFENVMSNFRSQVRIGCFTASADNLDMWEKYACEKTGFCIEYQTEKNKLFRYSTLPVLYSDKPYDSSLSLACSMILGINQKAKGRSLEEDSKIFKSVYEKMLKTAYIPLFIKEFKRWSFEEEYRMFLLKHRNTQIGMLKRDEILDKNYNINLSNTISAVYLGENFERNKNYEAIKNEIIQMAEEMQIKVFQKRCDGNKYINDRIL